MSGAGPGRGLCGVLLAAGAGTRLAPLTSRRPKALCPVANVTLLDRALSLLAELGLTGPGSVAVNAHYLGEQIVAAVGDRAYLSVEAPRALGTAGAIAKVSPWIGGRDVLVCNADAYLAGGDPGALLAGWTGEHARLLVTDDPARGDFGGWRFAGMSLLPAHQAARLRAEPAGLYEVVWRAAHRRGELELAPFDGVFIDCGRPADYLAANLHASGGANVVATDAVVDGQLGGSIVGAGAVVHGRLTRSVVWPGGYVGPDEHLVGAIRVDRDLTVVAGNAKDGQQQVPRG